MQDVGIAFIIMGGQAVVAYGAAEASRDLDICLATPTESIPRLAAWLARAGASARYFPPLDPEALARGHTAHFDVPLGASASVRLDVCTRPARIIDPEALVDRATSYRLTSGTTVAIMGLDDLLQTKKTQRLKDWAVIENLVDVDMAQSTVPDASRVRLWLREARDPEILVRLVAARTDLAEESRTNRHALDVAVSGDIEATRSALLVEQSDLMAADRAYQRSLTAELETMRHRARREAESDDKPH